MFGSNNTYNIVFGSNNTYSIVFTEIALIIICNINNWYTRQKTPIKANNIGYLTGTTLLGELHKQICYKVDRYDHGHLSIPGHYMLSHFHIEIVTEHNLRKAFFFNFCRK